jgi:hypothetical protein
MELSDWYEHMQLGHTYLACATEQNPPIAVLAAAAHPRSAQIVGLLVDHVRAQVLLQYVYRRPPTTARGFWPHPYRCKCGIEKSKKSDDSQDTNQGERAFSHSVVVATLSSVHKTDYNMGVCNPIRWL